MAQIVLESPEMLLALPLAWLLLVAVAWRRRFRPFGAFLLRLTIMVLVILALARPVLAPPITTAETGPAERLVVLVDQSASLGAAGQQALRAEAQRLLQGSPSAQVLFFADQPVLVEDPLAPLMGPSAGRNGPRLLNPEVSDLATALLTGAELLNEQPGRLVLLSDGLPTTGDALAAAARLARRNIPVDVFLADAALVREWQEGQNEVRLVRLKVPPVLRQGETFAVELIAHSESTAAEVTLKLTGPTSSDVLAEDVVTLQPGLNRYDFTATAEITGPHTFRASLAAAAGDDRQLKNNSVSAFAQVYPAPRVLLVSDEPVTSGRFAGLLRQAGFETQSMRPANLPTRLSALEPYAGMALLNVPAGVLELEQMIAIQEFVRSLGRGLLVTGGRTSFTLGDYEDTPLAELLPVTLEPPPREERPPVALLLIIDHSGSMLEQRESPTRLTMAKEAAIRAMDILGPDDLIGVFMFDNNYEWVVPFEQVSDGVELLAIQQRVARIPGGGGTRILQALEVALPVLMEQETSVARHAVLLTDGKSFDGEKTIADYDAIVDQAHEAGITLSTIAIGTGADVQLLSHLAERGRGRYHFAETPEELPALTISESDILRSNALQEGDFAVAIYAPHPLLRGLFSPVPQPDQSEAPALTGYLAMTPRPQAEVALQVGPGDPLLSVWGYGLGRVVAWSSDTGREWAATWREWSEVSRFWGQVVGYTLPAPDLGLLQLDAEINPDGTVTLVADSLTSTGQPVDLARTEATLLTPGGQETQVLLGQVAPGRYERQLRLPDPGAYQFAVTQSIPESATEAAASTGFILPYPAEYALPDGEAGPALLRQIASATGGQVLTLNNQPAAGVAAPPSASASTEPVKLWPWLLQAALILWPLEIAWRRWGRLRIQ